MTVTCGDGRKAVWNSVKRSQFIAYEFEEAVEIAERIVENGTPDGVEATYKIDNPGFLWIFTG